MIKINLLPQRKVKRRESEPGSKEFVFGVTALVAAGFAVWFLLDRPRRAHLADLKDSTKTIQGQIAQKTKSLEGYDALKAAADEVDKRNISINRLIAAKVVPANVLHELGEILMTGHPPTMTPEMQKLTSPSPTEGDPNKQYQTDWDATHVWLSSFTDQSGTFKLEGGAQSEGDVNQLSKRLAASVYFSDITPAGGARITDTPSGVTYYKFTITGKVAY